MIIVRHQGGIGSEASGPFGAAGLVALGVGGCVVWCCSGVAGGVWGFGFV